MRCPECGSTNSDRASFCWDCGTALFDDSPTEEQLLGDNNAHCQQCRSEIPVEAIRCPKCGYSPVDDRKTARKNFLIIGILLTVQLWAQLLVYLSLSLFGPVKRNSKRRGRQGSTLLLNLSRLIPSFGCDQKLGLPPTGGRYWSLETSRYYIDNRVEWSCRSNEGGPLY